MKSIFSSIIPHFFHKEQIPKITNSELLAYIKKVRETQSVEKAMAIALDILALKFQSKRLESLLFIHKICENDPNTLWERKGFLHCTHQNYLFRILMVKSGKLKDHQISLGYSLVWYMSPHQFLKVKLKNKVVAIDPWNYDRGASMGKFAYGFGVKSLAQ